MDPNNPVIKLCLEGSRAEFEGRIADACTLYRQAWETARDDYEACIAAHYRARHQEDPEEVFRWNQEALRRAEATADERVQPFYGSLYVNMGHSYEQVGNHVEAERYYGLASKLGVYHQVD